MFVSEARIRVVHELYIRSGVLRGMKVFCGVVRKDQNIERPIFEITVGEEEEILDNPIRLEDGDLIRITCYSRDSNEIIGCGELKSENLVGVLMNNDKSDSEEEGEEDFVGRLFWHIDCQNLPSFVFELEVLSVCERKEKSEKNVVHGSQKNLISEKVIKLMKLEGIESLLSISSGLGGGISGCLGSKKEEEIKVIGLDLSQREEEEEEEMEKKNRSNISYYFGELVGHFEQEERTRSRKRERSYERINLEVIKGKNMKKTFQLVSPAPVIRRDGRVKSRLCGLYYNGQVKVLFGEKEIPHGEGEFLLNREVFPSHISIFGCFVDGKPMSLKIEEKKKRTVYRRYRLYFDEQGRQIKPYCCVEEFRGRPNVLSCLRIWRINIARVLQLLDNSGAKKKLKISEFVSPEESHPYLCFYNLIERGGLKVDIGRPGRRGRTYLERSKDQIPVDLLEDVLRKGWRLQEVWNDVWKKNPGCREFRNSRIFKYVKTVVSSSGKKKVNELAVWEDIFSFEKRTTPSSSYLYEMVTVFCEYVNIYYGEILKKTGSVGPFDVLCLGADVRVFVDVIVQALTFTLTLVSKGEVKKSIVRSRELKKMIRREIIRRTFTVHKFYYEEELKHDEFSYKLMVDAHRMSLYSTSDHKDSEKMKFYLNQIEKHLRQSSSESLSTNDAETSTILLLKSLTGGVGDLEHDDLGRFSLPLFTKVLRLKLERMMKISSEDTKLISYLKDGKMSTCFEFGKEGMKVKKLESVEMYPKMLETLHDEAHMLNIFLRSTRLYDILELMESAIKSDFGQHKSRFSLVIEHLRSSLSYVLDSVRSENRCKRVEFGDESVMMLFSVQSRIVKATVFYIIRFFQTFSYATVKKSVLTLFEALYVLMGHYAKKYEELEDELTEIRTKLQKRSNEILNTFLPEIDELFRTLTAKIMSKEKQESETFTLLVGLLELLKGYYEMENISNEEAVKSVTKIEKYMNLYGQIVRILDRGEHVHSSSPSSTRISRVCKSFLRIYTDHHRAMLLDLVTSQKNEKMKELLISFKVSLSEHNEFLRVVMQVSNRNQLDFLMSMFGHTKNTFNRCLSDLERFGVYDQFRKYDGDGDGDAERRKLMKFLRSEDPLKESGLLHLLSALGGFCEVYFLRQEVCRLVELQRERESMTIARDLCRMLRSNVKTLESLSSEKTVRLVREVILSISDPRTRRMFGHSSLFSLEKMVMVKKGYIPGLMDRQHEIPYLECIRRLEGFPRSKSMEEKFTVHCLQFSTLVEEWMRRYAGNGQDIIEEDNYVGIYIYILMMCDYDVVNIKLEHRMLEEWKDCFHLDVRIVKVIAWFCSFLEFLKDCDPYQKIGGEADPESLPLNTIMLKVETKRDAILKIRDQINQVKNDDGRQGFEDFTWLVMLLEYVYRSCGYFDEIPLDVKFLDLDPLDVSSAIKGEKKDKEMIILEGGGRMEEEDEGEEDEDEEDQYGTDFSLMSQNWFRWNLDDVNVMLEPMQMYIVYDFGRRVLLLRFLEKFKPRIYMKMKNYFLRKWKCFQN